MVKVVFWDENGTKCTVQVPTDIANAIGLIATAINSSFIEGTSGILEFKFGTTKAAMLNYLRHKTSVVRQESEIWSGANMTVKDWCEMSHVASQMGDFDFFCDANKFPPLYAVCDCIEDFPPEAIVLYVEQYLTMCFSTECSCWACYWQRERQAALAEFEELPPQTQADLIDECRLYLGWCIIYPSNRSDSYLNICDRDTLPVNERKDTFINYDDWLVTGKAALFKSWFSRTVEEREIAMLVVGVNSRRLMIPACFDKQPFCTRWTTFNTTYPDFARFIWDNVDREVLLSDDVACVPTKRLTKMKKASFDEMAQYINSLRSKEQVVDPVEEMFRIRLRQTKRVFFHSATGEVAVAEAQLIQYLANKKRKEQQAASAEAVKQARTGISSMKIPNFHLNLARMNRNSKK